MSLLLLFNQGGSSAVHNAAATLAAFGSLAASGVRVQAATAPLAGAGALTASAEIPGQPQHLFTNQTPAITDASDGAPGITVGTTIRSAVDGYAQGVRWHTTATVGGTYIGALYRVDDADVPTPAGTLLAQKTLIGAPVPGGWQSITFDSPVPITAGVLYRAAVFSSDGRYVYAANIHTSDLVNGDLVADANGDDPAGLGTLRQATFTIGPTLAYPATGAGSNGSYFADINFVAGTAPVDGTATLPATGGLTAAASRSTAATASLTGTGTLTAAGTRTQADTGTLAGTGTLSAAALAGRAATTTLASSGGLTVAAVPTRAGAAILAAAGSLTASGDVITPGITTATLNGVGGLAATAARTTASSGTLAAIGALTAAGTREQAGTATVAAQGALTANPVLERAATAALPGIGALTAAGALGKEQTGTLAAVGGLTANASVIRSGSAALAAIGGLSAASGTTQTATAALAAVGGLTATVTYRRRPGRLTTGSRRSRLTPGGHR